MTETEYIEKLGWRIRDTDAFTLIEQAISDTKRSCKNALNITFYVKSRKDLQLIDLHETIDKAEVTR